VRVVPRWRESGNLERAVELAAGRDAFDVAVRAMLETGADVEPVVGLGQE
jgi:hypothetical protein